MMLQAFQLENIQTDYVRQIQQALPGLYLIRTDASGERSFYYYRQLAAVRHLFEGEEGKQLASYIKNFDAIYISGITLALFDETQLQRLLHGLQAAAKQGVSIWFDSNHRPGLWRSRDYAVWPWARMVLTTYDDEVKLHQLTQYMDCMNYYQNIPEVILKNGSAGVMGVIEDRYIEVPAIAVEAKDTTGAGDSFNAGYIAGRVSGQKPEIAADWGCQLASHVVQCAGAILPRDKSINIQ